MRTATPRGHSLRHFGILVLLTAAKKHYISVTTERRRRQSTLLLVRTIKSHCGKHHMSPFSFYPCSLVLCRIYLDSSSYVDVYFNGQQIYYVDGATAGVILYQWYSVVVTANTTVNQTVLLLSGGYYPGYVDDISIISESCTSLIASHCC